MSNNETNPNFGYVGGTNKFEEWACDDFNLFEYVEYDYSPFDLKNIDLNENDDNFDDNLIKKDMLYSTLQYNNVLLCDNQPQDLNNFSNNSAFTSFINNQNDNLLNEDALLPSTSKSISNVKIEYDHLNDLITFQNLENKLKLNQVETIEPKVRPRKYRIKPEHEKKNPLYRVKREKNNDAVRKSRDKAKKAQEEKEGRLCFLEKEKIRQSNIIEQLSMRNILLEKQITNMKRICTCQKLNNNFATL